mgnify:CR=1 FL=1
MGPLFAEIGLQSGPISAPGGELGATTGRKTAPSAECIAGSPPGGDFYASWGGQRLEMLLYRRRSTSNALARRGGTNAAYNLRILLAFLGESSSLLIEFHIKWDNAYIMWLAKPHMTPRC